MKKIGWNIIAVFFLCALFGTQAQDNPFRQGVNPTPLTKSDRDSLLQYINKSNETLQMALRTAKGKSLREASDIYMSAIRLAVIESYQGERRGELLMRYVLSQALALTYGIPTIDGRSFETRGILQGTVQEDLIAIILEDSIHLALAVIPTDINCVSQKESLVDLPYGSVAASRLVLARKWLASTFEWTGAYDLAVAALQHWFATVNDEQNMRRGSDAALLLEVNDLLMHESVGMRVQDPEELQRRVRVLRGVLRRVAENVSSSAKFVRSNSNQGDDTSFKNEPVDFGGKGSNLTVQQTILVGQKMGDVGKQNKILLDFFRNNIRSLSLDDVKSIVSGLAKYDAGYKEDDNTYSKKNVSKAIFIEYSTELQRRNQGFEADLEFFKVASAWPGAEWNVFNQRLEININSRISEISFAQLERATEMLEYSGAGWKELDESLSRKNTNIRLLDKWYQAHK